MLFTTPEKHIIQLLINYHGQYLTIYHIPQQLPLSSPTIHTQLNHLQSYIHTFSIQLHPLNKKPIPLNPHQQPIQTLKYQITQQQTIHLSLQ
ncbi:helix-turn-helix domain-containing protein, partial [Staphylococcus pasteuri]|uniref:helix-turn-helix domain-containing protein n=1 Tax=Staphylococcus pasteuri TaxID=45972 RepID=UPI001C99AEA0